MLMNQTSTNLLMAPRNLASHWPRGRPYAAGARSSPNWPKSHRPAKGGFENSGAWCNFTNNMEGHEANQTWECISSGQPFDMVNKVASPLEWQVRRRMQWYQLPWALMGFVLGVQRRSSSLEIERWYWLDLCVIVWFPMRRCCFLHGMQWHFPLFCKLLCRTAGVFTGLQGHSPGIRWKTQHVREKPCPWCLNFRRVHRLDALSPLLLRRWLPH